MSGNEKNLPKVTKNVMEQVMVMKAEAESGMDYLTVTVYVYGSETESVIERLAFGRNNFYRTVGD